MHIYDLYNDHPCSISTFEIKNLNRLSPDYTSCFSLITEDSPKSSHGHFRFVHLICVCSFNSGYLLLLLFRPVYLFYIAVGENINNQKTCPYLLLFSCSCINKQIIQSFRCIFKIIFNYESEVGVALQGFGAAVEFVHSLSFSIVHIYLRQNLDTRQDGHFCAILCVFAHLS